MELYPVKSVFGYADLAWYLKNWTRESLSRDWTVVQGTIEGYELHAAGHYGWLVVSYSYSGRDLEHHTLKPMTFTAKY